MKIISQLDETQEKQIPFYIEKWRDKCLLTAPITPALFEQGLQDIHEELGMEVPREFLYYLSPAAMWREFEVWKPKITRVLAQFWRYQVPLCDPSSMHRRWGAGSKRLEFNFAAKRYHPGPNYTLWETEDSNETSGTVIKKELHSQLWKRLWRTVAFAGCSGVCVLLAKGPIQLRLITEISNLLFKMVK